MDRKAFLEKLGIGAAFILTASCLGGCSEDDISPSTPVNLSLDLTDAANVNLLTDGGYVIKDGVVIARTLSGDYVAATQTCSHQNLRQIIYSNDEFYCTAHGARYAQDGNGLNSNGSRGLTVYQTELTGDILNIYTG